MPETKSRQIVNLEIMKRTLLMKLKWVPIEMQNYKHKRKKIDKRTQTLA